MSGGKYSVGNSTLCVSQLSKGIPLPASFLDTIITKSLRAEEFEIKNSTTYASGGSYLNVSLVAESDVIVYIDNLEGSRNAMASIYSCVQEKKGKYLLNALRDMGKVIYSEQDPVVVDSTLVGAESYHDEIVSKPCVKEAIMVLFGHESLDFEKTLEGHMQSIMPDKLRPIDKPLSHEFGFGAFTHLVAYENQKNPAVIAVHTYPEFSSSVWKAFSVNESFSTEEFLKKVRARVHHTDYRYMSKGVPIPRYRKQKKLETQLI